MRVEHESPQPGAGMNGGSRPCGDALQSASEASNGGL